MATAHHDGSETIATVRVIKSAIEDDVARLMDNDPIVREGTDPEGVHQARVACRRMRSQLRTFQKVLRKGAVAELVGDLRWFGTLLGAVRDLDVLAERLRDDCAEAPEEAAAAVLRRCAIDRQEAFSDAISAMRSKRYQRLLERLDEAADRPPVKASRADEPAPEVLLPEVRRRWDDLEAAVASLPRAPRDTELHHVRILAKRARYAAEIAAPLTSGDLEKLAKRVAKIQKVLGELNDASRAVAWLEQLKRAPSALAPAGRREIAGADPLTAVEIALAAEHVALASHRAGWRPVFERACEVAGGLGWTDLARSAPVAAEEHGEPAPAPSPPQLTAVRVSR